MLIIPYYIAVLTIAAIAAFSASFTLVGQEILERLKKRKNKACKSISCDNCKHDGAWSDRIGKRECAECFTKGFGRGFERKGGR